MGEMSLWERIWPWFQHPLDMAAFAVTRYYIEKHDLVLDYRQSEN